MNNFVNDKNLLCQLKSGDKEAFTKLYEVYSQPIYFCLLKLLKSPLVAEELLQEIFVLIWEKRETITVQYNLKNYLFRMAENKVHDFFRKLKRDKQLYEYIIDTSSKEFDINFEEIVSVDEKAILEKALCILPPQRRVVFYMCKLEGKSYKEVSQSLGISVSTINDHIVKATRSVREFLISHPELSSLNLLLLFLDQIVLFKQ